MGDSGWFNDNSLGIGDKMNELFDAILKKGESLINWIKSPRSKRRRNNDGQNY